jgi:hypothetical protein
MSNMAEPPSMYPRDSALSHRSSSGIVVPVTVPIPHTRQRLFELLERPELYVVGRSSFDKRAGLSRWVVRAHQAAAIAAMVHNRGREPIWR